MAYMHAHSYGTPSVTKLSQLLQAKFVAILHQPDAILHRLDFKLISAILHQPDKYYTNPILHINSLCHPSNVNIDAYG